MMILLAIYRLYGAHSLLEAKKPSNQPLWTMWYYVTITMCLISVYTVTFNSKQAVLFSNPGLVYTEHV